MKNMWTVLLLLGIPLLTDSYFGVGLGVGAQLKLVSEWRSIDFNFPTIIHLQAALTLRDYIPGNAVPLDVDIHYQDGFESRVFVTFPRFREGIPVTLGTRSASRSQDGSQLIDPYPDITWHMNPAQDCNNRMVSVFRIAIDECQRLWVVDTGKIGLSPAPYICPPKILVFNLLNNQLIHRYIIPRNQFTDRSLFINPIIDVSDPPPGFCANSKAYIADVAGFGLLVYDSSTDSSWRVENKLMFPYPSFGTHTICGESFELMDGIFGVAIDKNRRQLYFHALASEHENVVSLDVVNNRTAWESDRNSFPNAFTILGPKGSQSAASAIDSNGNLFFGLNALNTLACWDTSRRPLNRAVIKTLVTDKDKLQFISGMKVKRNTDGEEELWMITNRFQKVSTGTLNNREINFRIQAQRISELLGGTRCF